MHYKNGKEVKIGDKVVSMGPFGEILVGHVLYAYPSNDSCNLGIVPIGVPILSVTASNCLLDEDAIVIERPSLKAGD